MPSLQGEGLQWPDCLLEHTLLFISGTLPGMPSSLFAVDSNDISSLFESIHGITCPTPCMNQFMHHLSTFPWCPQDCMAALGPFSKSHYNVTDAQSLADDFFSLCSSTTTSLNSTGRCAAVQAAISGSANLAKRAAGLCSALQLCDAVSSCSVPVISATTNNTVSVVARDLSSCTVEGIPVTSPDATLLPGFVSTLTPLPPGACATSSDCGDASYYGCR